MVDDEIAMEEFVSEAAAADDPGSPVADMIERLADETQDFAAAEPELAFDEMAAEDAAEPVPAPEPTRKKACVRGTPHPNPPPQGGREFRRCDPLPPPP